jgi:hypothetical protein
VPVCEVMVLFCQLPPAVAVTQAWAWVDRDKPQTKANTARNFEETRRRKGSRRDKADGVGMFILGKLTLTDTRRAPLRGRR